MNKLGKATLTAAAAGLAIYLGAAPASAYGLNSWTVQPYGCNPGTYTGLSQYISGRAHAETIESGNFCWIGNVKVAVAVHDTGNTTYGWVTGSDNASADHYGSNLTNWGGFHSWGDSGARRT